MHIVTHSDIEAKAKANGISMRQICLRAGVSESTHTRWKYGRLSPRICVVERLVNALNDILGEQKSSDEAA